MWKLCSEQGLVYEVEVGVEVEAAVPHRGFPPSRHRNRGPHRPQDERLEEVAVVDCCFVLVDRSRIVRDSVDTRCRPDYIVSKDDECEMDMRPRTDNIASLCISCP
jgi:hypothetical protein